MVLDLDMVFSVNLIFCTPLVAPSMGNTSSPRFYLAKNQSFPKIYHGCQRCQLPAKKWNSYPSTWWYDIFTFSWGYTQRGTSADSSSLRKTSARSLATYIDTRRCHTNWCPRRQSSPHGSTTYVVNRGTELTPDGSGASTSTSPNQTNSFPDT